MAMTVNELLNECKKLKQEGFGDYQIYISSDDEGNDFHALYYSFLTDPEEIKKFLYRRTNNNDNVVLLG